MSIISRAPAGVTQLSGGVAWSSPEDTIEMDGISASATLLTGQESSPLEFDGFGFTLPADAVITGIDVIVRCAALPLGPGEAFTVYLVTDGTQRASKSAEPASDSLTEQHFGGPTDAWGLTLTAAEINDPSFLLQVKAGIVDLTASAEFLIDGVVIEITYSSASNPAVRARRSAVKLGVGIYV